MKENDDEFNAAVFALNKSLPALRDTTLAMMLADIFSHTHLGSESPDEYLNTLCREWLRRQRNAAERM